MFRDHTIYAFLQILSCHTAVVAFKVFIHFLIYSKLVRERHNKNSVISRFWCLKAVLICTGDWLHSEGNIAKLYGTILTKMHNTNVYTEDGYKMKKGVYTVNKPVSTRLQNRQKALSLHSKQLKTTLVYTVNHPTF